MSEFDRLRKEDRANRELALEYAWFTCPSCELDRRLHICLFGQEQSIHSLLVLFVHQNLLKHSIGRRAFQSFQEAGKQYKGNRGGGFDKETLCRRYKERLLLRLLEGARLPEYPQ